MTTTHAPSGAEKIGLLREALGWTQEELGTRIGISRVQVNHLENGRNHGSSYAIREKLARGFGLSVEEIAGLIDGRLEVKEALSKIQGA